MLKLISGGILALGGAGLLGVLALGGAGFDASGASAGSPSTTLVLVCDRVGVDSAKATVELSNAAGDVLIETIECSAADLRNRERIVAFNADSAILSHFLVTKSGLQTDCPELTSLQLPQTYTCTAVTPQATLTVR